jgi:hypothetical protein
MHQLKRALISLSFMLAFMIVLEIVRMGLANDSKTGVNTVKVYPGAISAADDSTYLAKKYLLLYDGNEKHSAYAKDNYSELLKYLKIDFDLKDVKEYSGDYKGYDCVLITTADWALIKGIPSLVSYVEAGGNAAFLLTPLAEGTYYTLSSYLGIIETGNPTQRQGVITQGNFMICGPNLKFDYPSVLNYAYGLQLSKECEVLLRAGDNVPLVWSIKKGQGKIAVCNTDLTKSKNARGVVTGIIANLEEDFNYPISNAWVTFLTAFPTTSTSTNNAYIRKLYAVDTNSFIRNLWWPDMLRIYKKYRIYYTSVFVQNYTENVKPPFYQEGLSKNDLIGLGSDILRSRGEIGFNGYNYRPLGLKGDFKMEGWFVPWTEFSDMVMATQEVVKFTHTAFPNYELKTYAPPAGQLSPEGRRAVIEGCNTVKVISGLYESNWGNQLVQEFKTESDGIVSLPRIASGFDPPTGIEWNLANSAEATGIISHDINMIEILFPDGKGVKWSAMYKKLTDILNSMRASYSYIEPKTASNAGVNIDNTTKLAIKRKADEKGIYISASNLTPSQEFILRSEKEVKSTNGCTVTKINASTYLVKAEKAEFSIIWN